MSDLFWLTDKQLSRIELARPLARKDAGETNREIAAVLRISPSCVSKWTKRKRETGSLAPAQLGGYKPRTLSGDWAAWVRARIASGPFTLRGLAEELAGQGAAKTNPRAVWVFVHTEGLSFKKPCYLRSRHDLTWCASGRAGRRIRARLRPSAWCPSMSPHCSLGCQVPAPESFVSYSGGVVRWA